MEDKRIEALRKSKAKTEAGIQQIQNALDQLKGDTGEQATKKREALNLKQDRLRQIRERIEMEIKKLDGAPSEVAKIEEEIATLEKQIEAKREAVGQKIEALREKQELIIGDNDLLKRLLAKERVQLKLKWNRQILAIVEDQEQSEEINAQNDALQKKLKKYEDEFADAMDGIVEKFKDNPVAAVAKEQTDEEMKVNDQKTIELARLRDELEKAETDAAKDGIQSRIDSLEDEGKSEDEKRIMKNIRGAKKSLEGVKGNTKEAKDSRAAAQMILDNYQKQLERLQKKQSEKEPEKTDAPKQES